MKSTHKAEVVPIELLPHPNADSLSIVKVWGYQVIVRTEDFRHVDRGVYIVPDSLVPNREPFTFMFNGSNPTYYVNPDETAVKDKNGNYARVTVRRFRGIYSSGLLLPVSKDTAIGADLAPAMGIVRYVPATTCSAPPSHSAMSDMGSSLHEVTSLTSSMSRSEARAVAALPAPMLANSRTISIAPSATSSCMISRFQDRIHIQNERDLAAPQDGASRDSSDFSKTVVQRFHDDLLVRLLRRYGIDTTRADLEWFSQVFWAQSIDLKCRFGWRPPSAADFPRRVYDVLSLSLDRRPEDLRNLMDLFIDEWQRQAGNVLQRFGYEIPW